MRRGCYKNTVYILLLQNIGIIESKKISNDQELKFLAKLVSVTYWGSGMIFYCPS